MSTIWLIRWVSSLIRREREGLKKAESARLAPASRVVPVHLEPKSRDIAMEGRRGDHGTRLIPRRRRRRRRRRRMRVIDAGRRQWEGKSKALDFSYKNAKGIARGPFASLELRLRRTAPPIICNSERGEWIYISCRWKDCSDSLRLLSNNELNRIIWSRGLLQFSVLK